MEFPFGGAVNIWADLRGGTALDPQKAEIRDWAGHVEDLLGAVDGRLGAVDGRLGAVDEVAAALVDNGILQARDDANSAADRSEAALDATTLIAATKGAYRDTTITAAIAQGVAALAEGDTFTAAADDVDYIGLYVINTGPIVAEIAQYPSASLLVQKQIIGRQSATDFTGNVAVGTYIIDDPVNYTGTLTGVWARVTGAGTLRIGRWKLENGSYREIGVLANVVTSTTGAQYFPITPAEIKEGEYIGFYTPHAKIAYSANTANGAGWHSSTADVTLVSKGTPVTIQRLEIGFQIQAAISVAKASEQGLRLDSLETATADLKYSTTQGVGKNDGEVVTAGSNVSSMVLILGGAAVADGRLDEFAIFMTASGTLSIKIFDRDGLQFTQTSTTVSVPVVAGLNILTATQFGEILVRAGQYVGFYASAQFKYISGTSYDTAYYGSLGSATTTSIAATAYTSAKLQVRATFRQDVASKVAVLDDKMSVAYDPPPVLHDEVIAATATATGLSVAVTARMRYIGGYADGSATLVLDATTGTAVRYDLIKLTLDPITLVPTITVVKGTERTTATTDASHFLPSVSAANDHVLFHARVKSGVVSAIPVWSLEDGVDKSATEQVTAMIARAKGRLPKTMAKLRVGAPLHIVGFGDSITAIQSAGPSTATPNGTSRDRATSFLATGYGADVYNDTGVVPLFTAVQLGRADDGAGAVHSKIGIIWHLVKTLEAQGRVLGTDLTYDNFGIGGYKSDDAVSGSTPTAWLTNAAALGADLAIVAMGMNELDSATFSGTLARMVIIAQTFQAAGTEVLFTDCPRRRAVAYTTGGKIRRVARVTRNAADFTGSALVSFSPVVEEGLYQALGLYADDVGEVSDNHPGLREMAVYGGLLAGIVK